jgi:hypothetical protein
MMHVRLGAAAAAAWLLAGGGGLAGGAPRTARELYREAAAARARKDFPLYLDKAREAAALAPDSPPVLVSLARALALNGRGEEALRPLERLAILGAFHEVDGDADLASLRRIRGLGEVKRRLEALQAPVGTSTVAFTIPQRDLIPEGVAHDRKTGDFFVGSVHRRKIVRVVIDAAGAEVTDFATAGRDGLFAVLGLAVDAERRLLWACSSAVPEMEGYRPEDEGRAALFKYDLETGRLLARLERPPDGTARNFNDLAVGSGGDVFVSDARDSGLYRVRSGTGTLEVLVDPGTFASPQGLALSPDESRLLVSDYPNGIAAVDLASRSVTRLPPPPDTLLGGIDGLAAYGGRLVAIQNGIEPHRVLLLTLDDSGDRIAKVELLQRRHPAFAEPTLGVVVGDLFYYVANSQWGSFDENRTIWPPERLAAPVVLQLRLP